MLARVESLVTPPPATIMSATDGATRPKPSAAGGVGLDQQDRRGSSTTMAAVRSASSNPSPLPSPFDDSGPSLFQGADADDKCPKFMAALLSNPTFKSCYPLSMLLQVRLHGSPSPDAH